MVGWTFDAASRMLTSVAAGGTTNYSYSAEGTQALVVEPAGARYTFTQDVEFRLASQSSSSGTRSWFYDAEGRMHYYTGPSPAGSVTFVWDFDNYLEIRT